MSYKYVPRFVWYPVAALGWAFSLLVVGFTLMSTQAKSLEIDFLNLKIKVKKVDQQISIAQKNISTAMDVINSVTQQLKQSQSSLPPEKTKLKEHPQSNPLSSHGDSYSVIQAIVQQLQTQKVHLETINEELHHVQNNLQLSVAKEREQ